MRAGEVKDTLLRCSPDTVRRAASRRGLLCARRADGLVSSADRTVSADSETPRVVPPGALLEDHVAWRLRGDPTVKGGSL
jgi:hypothetical protein